MSISGKSPVIARAGSPGRRTRSPHGRLTAGIALPAIGVAVALMVAIGVLGPSAAVATFPPAPPWPPWFIHAHVSPVLTAIVSWLAVLIGGSGVAAGLAA